MAKERAKTAEPELTGDGAGVPAHPLPEPEINPPADTRDFAPVFKSIAEEIRSGYTLAYYPPESNRRDGRVHQIRVECKRVGAIIRASRTSYQAPAK